MKLRRKTSDDEYVELIRKRYLTLRRVRWLWVILLFALIFCMSNFADVFGRISADFPLDRSLMYAGILLGAVFGMIMAIVGAQAALCIKQWIDARHGFRTERLMLKYHDELRYGETSNTILEPSSNSEDAVGGGSETRSTGE